MPKRSRRTKPAISIIIPVRELSYHLIFENIPALNLQNFKNFEVVVLPNEHSQYDLTLLKKYRWLRIIPTGKVTRPAAKRNIGAKEARGKYLAFIDDDAYPDRSWLERSVRLLKRSRARAVCGPGIVPSDATTWERAFDLLLRSWIGSGTYSYRFVQKPSRFVLDHPSMNFIMHRVDFVNLRGFKNDYWPGEDSKLCNEIVTQLRGRIRYDPSILVYHHRRPSLRAFLKQHDQYGFHRGAFFAHGDSNSRELSYVVPALFVMYLSLYPVLLLCSWISSSPQSAVLITAPLMLYGLLSIVFLIQSLINSRSITVAFKALLALISMHLVYGTAFIRGFKKGRKKYRSIYE